MDKMSSFSDIKCSICYDDQDLQLLPCLHVVCLDCSPRGKMDSLHCRRCLKVPQKGGSTAVFKPIKLTPLRGMRSSLQCGVKCTSCSEEVSATKACFDCCAAMCDVCFKAHQRLSNLTKGHFVTDSLTATVLKRLIRCSYEMCAQHPSKRREFFCEVTNQPICCLCLFEPDHAAHDGDCHCKLSTKRDALDRLFDEAKTSLHNTERTLTKGIVDVTHEIERATTGKVALQSRIQKMENILHELITERFKALYAEVDNHTITYQSDLKNMQASCVSLLYETDTLLPWLEFTETLPNEQANSVMPLLIHKYQQITANYDKKCATPAFKTFTYSNEYLDKVERSQEWPSLDEVEKKACNIMSHILAAIEPVVGCISVNVKQDCGVPELQPSKSPQNSQHDSAYSDNSDGSTETYEDDNELSWCTESQMKVLQEVEHKNFGRGMARKRKLVKGKIRPHYRQTWVKL